MFYGQHKEDAYIETLFPKNHIGVCVEVGAYNGIDMSNTYYFENMGWRALCVEPILNEFAKCRQVRKECINCSIAEEEGDDRMFYIYHMKDNVSAMSSLAPDYRLIKLHQHLITNITNYMVSVRSLTSVLNEVNFPKNIDFISIDTENTELEVLQGIDFNTYNIKLFVIENNFEDSYCEDYLKLYGYRKIHRIAVNDFFEKV